MRIVALIVVLDFSHLSPSSEKQLILLIFFCSLKNSTEKFGGLFALVKYLSVGRSSLYSNGYKLIKNLNLFKSPYFSLIGKRGNSNLSLFKSITPECWPKAISKFFEM